MKKQLTPLLFIALVSAGCGQASDGTSALPTAGTVTTTVPATANSTTQTSTDPTTTTPNGGTVNDDSSTVPPASTPDPDSEILPATSLEVHPTNVTPPPPDDEVEDGVTDDFQPEFNADELVEPGVVRLYVSNQSFADPSVHLTVKVDGQVIADQDFAVESQHNWVIFDTPVLTPGPHELTAESSTGVTITETFTLPDGEARYIGVDYWYYPEEGEDRFISVEQSEIPMVFA